MKQEMFDTRAYLHPELTDIALARFAGLFIGEGSMGIYNSGGSYQWRAQIGMTCAEDITTDLKRFFGGYVNLESREKTSRLPLLYWQINNQEATVFIKAIFPFMCWKLKRDQAIIFLESFEEFISLPRRNIGRGLTERAKSIAEQAKKDITSCKQAGCSYMSLGGDTR